MICYLQQALDNKNSFAQCPKSKATHFHSAEGIVPISQLTGNSLEIGSTGVMKGEEQPLDLPVMNFKKPEQALHFFNRQGFEVSEDEVTHFFVEQPLDLPVMNFGQEQQDDETEQAENILDLPSFSFPARHTESQQQIQSYTSCVVSEDEEELDLPEW